MQYNWQQHDWPHFTYSLNDDLLHMLISFAEEAGHANGVLKMLPANMQGKKQGYGKNNFRSLKGKLNLRLFYPNF